MTEGRGVAATAGIGQARDSAWSPGLAPTRKRAGR
jgi:hypothetical protein